ncbi:hypothetical protein MPTA5024_27700 [Microbispora sp. ATCC PTA-5024]|nr:hypothetical protein MPTA5024_27700 [Microbispora sp. ATCC PTA-5024]
MPDWDQVADLPCSRRRPVNGKAKRSVQPSMGAEPALVIVMVTLNPLPHEVAAYVTARAMAEGFQFVSMARALLCEPDLVDRMRRSPATRSLCVHCNAGMPTIYTGTHCVSPEAGGRPRTSPRTRGRGRRGCLSRGCREPLPPSPAGGGPPSEEAWSNLLRV